MAPTIAPPALVLGAPRVPLLFGLFSVLAPRPEGDGRWQNGITWETLTCEPAGGIGAPLCTSVDTVQSVTIGGAGLTSFTLTHLGQTTATIAAAATAANVQAALVALSNLEPGDVVVTGPAGGPYQVTFQGNLAGDPVPAMTATPTGGTGTVTVEIEQVGESTIGLPKELDPLDAQPGEGSPFTVYGHHTCSPIGNTLEWAKEQARQHLVLREEARVEQALWTGDLGNVPNFAGANGYPAIPSAGSFPLAQAWRAVSRLEQEIAQRYGALGVLHMSREVASILTDDGKLSVAQGRITTALGTPVVAGTGYSSNKIVATPALFGYRSEVFDSSDQPYDLLDRAVNDLYAIAERTYVLGFDPCGAVSATLTTE